MSTLMKSGFRLGAMNVLPCRTQCQRLIALIIVFNVFVVMFNVYNIRGTGTEAPCRLAPEISNQTISVHPTVKAEISTEWTEPNNVSFTLEPHGSYLVMANYIKAELDPSLNETITLTTQATLEFLHHVKILCRRWAGPISVAVYAPGTDFNRAKRIIWHQRHCEDKCVLNNVTWHIIFDKTHRPINDRITAFNCSIPPIQPKSSFKSLTKLVYPINIARNLARKTAKTQYVLASDVELYPSLNIIPRFLDLVNRLQLPKKPPNVFVLPIFEVKANLAPPENKTKLKGHLSKNEAVFFHKFVCDSCQKFPSRDKWVNIIPPDETLNIFVTTKRNSSLNSWEPIYIGSNEEPFYEENLSWEGKRDKMSQMFEMCLMDYNVNILDNAFLVHAPGIKTISHKEEHKRLPYMRQNNKVYGQVIKTLIKKYNGRHNC